MPPLRHSARRAANGGQFDHGWIGPDHGLERFAELLVIGNFLERIAHNLIFRPKHDGKAVCPLNDVHGFFRVVFGVNQVSQSRHGCVGNHVRHDGKAVLQLVRRGVGRRRVGLQKQIGGRVCRQVCFIALAIVIRILEHRAVGRPRQIGHLPRQIVRMDMIQPQHTRQGQ